MEGIEQRGKGGKGELLGAKIQRKYKLCKCNHLRGVIRRAKREGIQEE